MTNFCSDLFVKFYLNTFQWRTVYPTNATRFRLAWILFKIKNWGAYQILWQMHSIDHPLLLDYPSHHSHQGGQEYHPCFPEITARLHPWKILGYDSGRIFPALFHHPVSEETGMKCGEQLFIKIWQWIPEVSPLMF